MYKKDKIKLCDHISSQEYYYAVNTTFKRSLSECYVRLVDPKHLIKMRANFVWHGLTEIRARVNNYINYFIWDVFIHPCPNFNGGWA